MILLRCVGIVHGAVDMSLHNSVLLWGVSVITAGQVFRLWPGTMFVIFLMHTFSSIIESTEGSHTFPSLITVKGFSIFFIVSTFQCPLHGKANMKTAEFSLPCQQSFKVYVP